MGELLTSWQQHKNRSVQIRLLTERTCTLSLSLVILPLSSSPHYRTLTLSLTLLTIAAPFRIVVVAAVNEVGLLTLQQPGRGIAEADCYRCF